MTLPPVTAPVLDDQLCADLFAASRAVVAAYDASLAPIGLSYVQYLVLLVVWEVDRPATIGEIGRRLDMSVDELQPLVRSMVVAGFLEREANRLEPSLSLVTPGRRSDEIRRPVTDVQCDIRDGVGLAPATIRDLQHNLRSITATLRDLPSPT